MERSDRLKLSLLFSKEVLFISSILGKISFFFLFYTLVHFDDPLRVPQSVSWPPRPATALHAAGLYNWTILCNQHYDQVKSSFSPGHFPPSQAGCQRIRAVHEIINEENMPATSRFVASSRRREDTAEAPAKGLAISLDSHNGKEPTEARKFLEHCCPNCPTTG